ncbi:MAG: hypothetical protein ACTS5I_15525, partial [Rhodanobacter sp.]
PHPRFMCTALFVILVFSPMRATVSTEALGGAPQSSQYVQVGLQGKRFETTPDMACPCIVVVHKPNPSVDIPLIEVVDPPYLHPALRMPPSTMQK